MKLIKNIILILSAIISICCTTTSALAYSIQGTVVYVYDGDTIKLREGLNYHRIRLAAIDAPEKDQPYGAEAAQLLSKLVLNKTVLANVIDIDKYGRKIGYIYLPNITSHSEQANCDTSILPHSNPNLLSVNCYLLTAGAAWHYKAFDKNSAKYDLHCTLEQQARANHRGLWTQPNPIAPWIWRKKLQPEDKVFIFPHIDLYRKKHYNIRKEVLLTAVSPIVS